MSLLGNLMNEKKKTIDGQSYWHHSLLSNWSKNEDYRILKEKDWLRLLKSIKKYGVKLPFEIDINGTTYDGNHKLKAVNELVSQGISKAENGKELEWIPVNVHPVPSDEAEEVKLAAIGNGDKDFATWNRDAVANHKDFFESIPDYEDLVFDFEDPVTFGDVFETYEEMDEPVKEKRETCQACLNYHEQNHQVTTNS